MNIDEVKHNLENGILVSKPTLLKLAQAALEYEIALTDIANGAAEKPDTQAAFALSVVGEL